jgi:Initiator Replication protein
MENILKLDINFLEYPLWIVDERNNSNKIVLKKDYGTYTITSASRLPNHFDVIVLYQLLCMVKEQNNFTNLELNTTRYALIKAIHGDKNYGGKQFKEIMSTLKRWKDISLSFEGIFYEDNQHTTQFFGVVDGVKLNHETNKLIIRFNQDFIKQLNQTGFFRHIDFEKYKKLRRAVSSRLYEILCKSFHHDGQSFSINFDSLAEKLTLEKRKGAALYYPSDVVRQLKIAAEEISTKTDLQVSFEFKKDERLCLFKCKKKSINQVKDSENL